MQSLQAANCNLQTRSGVVLVLALVVMLVLSIVIIAFHSTTMQGRREVSRAYLGDAAMFLAESCALEGLAAIQEQANRGDSEWYLAFREARPEDNGKRLPIDEVGRDSELASEIDAQLSASARILVLYQSQNGDPREKAGSIEVEGKAVVPLDSKRTLTRRVIVRRDFKGLFLTYANPLSSYTLFVKDTRGFPPVSPASVDPAAPKLIVKNRREPTTPPDGWGAVYLGQGGGSWTQISLLPPGRTGKMDPQESQYFQGMKVALSPTNKERYLMGKWDDEKQTFTDESMGQERARAIIADMLKHLYAGKLDPAQAEAVVSKVLDAKMTNRYLAGDARSAGLDLYINDPGRGVEGNLVYPYWFHRELDFKFQGATPPTKPETDVPVLVSAASVLERNPNAWDLVRDPLSTAKGLDGMQTRQERLNAIAPLIGFTDPKLYSRIYTATALDPDPAASFRDEYIGRTSAGAAALRVDGLVAVIGDLSLDNDTVYRGQGAVITLGRLEVKGALSKSNDNDHLFLVSRGPSLVLPGGKKVHACVQALDLGYPDNICSFEVSDTGPLDLVGGLQIDRLDASRLRGTMNLVQYDERLGDWVYHTSFSERLFLWVARGDDDSGSKEIVDG